jgi:hypothetical protein
LARSGRWLRLLGSRRQLIFHRRDVDGDGLAGELGRLAAENPRPVHAQGEEKQRMRQQHAEQCR